MSEELFVEANITEEMKSKFLFLDRTKICKGVFIPLHNISLVRFETEYDAFFNTINLYPSEPLCLQRVYDDLEREYFELQNAHLSLQNEYSELASKIIPIDMSVVPYEVVDVPIGTDAL